MVIKKLFIGLVSIFLIFILLLSIFYSLLVYKPNKLIQFIDRFFVNEYRIEYEELITEKNFLKPRLNFHNLILKDSLNKEVIKIAKINIGIDLIGTVFFRYLNFSILEIKDIFIIHGQNSQSTRSFKISIDYLKIKTDDFNFETNKTNIFSINGNISVSSIYGKFNNLIFNRFKILKKYNSKKFYYTAIFNLNEKIIEDENLIDLKNFSNYKINLNLESKGYYDTQSKNLISLNKYLFKNSELETVDKYSISNIDLILYSNLDNTLAGLFSSSLPDQEISGSMFIEDEKIILYSVLNYEVSELFGNSKYLTLDGNEKFKSKIEIQNGQISLDLITDSLNIKISSVLKDLEKARNEKLDLSIKIKDLSNPTYLINSDKYNSFIDENNNGYFIFGKGYENNINKYDDGFHIILNLSRLDIEDLLIDDGYQSSENLSTITAKIEELNILNNIYLNQEIKINFLDNETDLKLSGINLNGSIKVDDSSFTKIDLFNTKLEFKEFNFNESSALFNLDNINLRFMGKNIETYNNLFDEIDFYILSNKKITTIDNIKISSKQLNIGPYNENKKAYISYNKTNDLYKVRGSYEIIGKDFPFKNLINYDFEFLSTDLSIQWESLKELKDLEGNIKFLIKDFESKASLPDSNFLKALKIFNLNAMIENINNDSSIVSSNLFINRAEGDFYIGKNRALINDPIKIETPEAKMRWVGEVLKDSDGLLNELSLDLEMRLKVSENIPWYAAIFGGMPALAGGLFIENILEDRLEDVSTFNFKISGSIDNPKIIRLD